MAFKTDIFKRLREEKWAKMSDEERAAELKWKADLKARILYREDIDIHHPHYGRNNNIIDATALILKDDEGKYHLSFVDRSDREYAYKTYWGYYLDGRFIERGLQRSYDKFLLDVGSDIGIEGKRFKALLTNITNRLKELNIDLKYDYNPQVTEMLKGTKLY